MKVFTESIETLFANIKVHRYVDIRFIILFYYTLNGKNKCVFSYFLRLELFRLAAVPPKLYTLPLYADAHPLHNF